MLAWLSVFLAGIAVPAAALLVLLDGAADIPLILVAAPILAIGLMGAGMISAAAAGRFWIGVLLSVMTGTGLLLLASTLAVPAVADPVSIGLVFLIASISFAARGALFAKSAAGKGWWIAIFVVGGEAAILITASVEPGALPDWLLVLLPAQWANIAIQTVLSGAGMFAPSSALLALGGTAMATLLVAHLWPRRWPYLIMFTVWLGFSALVWYRPAPPIEALI